MTDDRNPTAREYLRVSRDTSGRERSIDEQHEDNARDAEAHGWTLVEPYREVGSASRYATKARGDFESLVADLEADRFGADMLVIWESSRGSRRTGEWCHLIDVCKDHGVKIRVTTHARTYDPANAGDRRSLREDASDSEYETDKLSERSLRAHAASAADGRPNGKIPYGYRRRYDPVTRRLIAQEPDPVEAPVVREMYDRIRRGHSIRAIARDLDRRGVRTRSGRPWTAAHIRSLVVRRTYVGDRTHTRDGRTSVVPATWPGLVSRETWQSVHSILTDKTRLTRRPGGARHLLSMIVVCDVCGGPLAAHGQTASHRRWEYVCHHRGHVRVDYDELTDLAEATMLAYLSRPDNVERLTATDSAEVARVREQVAGIRGELDDLADKVGRGELSATLAARAEPRILERLRAAEAREAELATPSQLRDLITPGADVARRWQAAPMSARREVVRILLSPDVLGELRVTRSPTPGRKSPITDRVTWRTA